MMTILMLNMLDLLRCHASRTKPLDQETINTIITSGQAAATSSNVQATTVIHVTDPQTREKLATAAGGQKYVETAGAFFVFCADLKRSAQACVLQEGEFSQGMTEHFIIATVDVALFAQNCTVAAESLGMGICYIGGLRNNPADVSDLLNLPENVYPVFGLCVGYPEQDPDIKPRLPLTYLHLVLQPMMKMFHFIIEHEQVAKKKAVGAKKCVRW